MINTPDTDPDEPFEVPSAAERQARAETDLTAHATRNLNRLRVWWDLGALAFSMAWVVLWLVLLDLVGDAVDDFRATESFWYWPAGAYELALFGVVMWSIAQYLWPFLCTIAKQWWYYGLKLLGRYAGPVCDRCGGPHASPHRESVPKTGSLRKQLTHPRHLAWRASELAMVVLGSYALVVTDGWDTTPAVVVCMAIWAMEDASTVVLWRAEQRHFALEELLPERKTPPNA